MQTSPMEIAHLGRLLVGIGFGLCAVGAGIGVGQIVAAALNGIARQPEQAGKIQTVMFPFQLDDNCIK